MVVVLAVWLGSQTILSVAYLIHTGAFDANGLPRVEEVAEGPQEDGDDAVAGAETAEGPEAAPDESVESYEAAVMEVMLNGDLLGYLGCFADDGPAFRGAFGDEFCGHRSL